MGNLCTSLYSCNYPSKNMSETRQFVKDRTIKVSGISEFLKDQITTHFQAAKADEIWGDVARVHVCPEGKDHVLVEFCEKEVKTDSGSSEVDIHGSELTIEPYSMQPSSAKHESVSKIWDIDNGKMIDTSGAHGGKLPGSWEQRENRSRKQNSSKEKRKAQVEGKRKFDNTEQGTEAPTANISQESSMFEDTNVKLNDKILKGMISENHNEETKEMLRKQDVEFDEKNGYLSGPWNAVGNVFNQLRSIFGRAPSSSLDEVNDSNGNVIRVYSNVMRYIMTYHYNMFEELEKVSSQIQFEYISASEKSLKVVAREGIDEEKFKKSFDTFIDFYQKLYPDMYQENIPVHQMPSSSALLDDLILDAHVQFSVIVFFDANADANQITVYGPKEKAEKAARFIKEKINVSGNSNNSRNAGGSIPREHMSCPISKKVKIFVYQGDITEQKVDAIVNPANERLEHDGGAAKVISRKGGSVIQSECNDIMRRRGKWLNPGDVEATKAGRLPCKFVVHAVGPVWSNYRGRDACHALKKAVLGSLEIASKNEARSIAIPAISSGIFGTPVNICAEVLFNAAEEFVVGVGESSSLAEIRFVNIDAPTVNVFRQEMRKRYKSAVTNGQDEGSDNARMNAGTTNTWLGDNPSKDRSRQSVGTGVVINEGKTSDPLKNIPPNNMAQQPIDTKNDDGSRQKGKDGEQRFYVAKPGIDPATSYSAMVTKGSNSSNDKMSNGDTSDCPICLDVMKNPKTLDKCKHSFCTECIENAFKHQKKCPLCSEVYGVLTGDQPYGTMTSRTLSSHLPGYPKCGTINIYYTIPSGTQGPNHPNPGKPYTGTSRSAHLPDNQTGKKVHKLLRKAFDQKVTFTIGRSSTTGAENAVVWNDIHHKTQTHGGPTSYGYPDPNYLRRVQEELAAKGIKE